MLDSIYNNIVSRIQANKYNFLGFDNIDHQKINSLGTKLRATFDTAVIVGLGASSLNVRVLVSALTSPTKKVLYLDSLDQVEINEQLKSINPSRTVFFSLSRSGNTNETYLLTEYVLNILRIPPEQVYIIAPSSDNLLFNLSKSQLTNYFEHDEILSGRFGIFTNATLLPAVFLGVDIHKILAAAKDKISNIMLETKSAVCQEARYYLDNYSANRHILILFNYCYQLDGLYRWQQQIIAESLGKNNFGITPVISKGTFDQHSQLQLYLEGPDDKFYRIITHNQTGSAIALSLASHADNIYNALLSTKRPVTLENYADINEQIIVEKVIDTMLVVMLVADSLQINPFDQPSVDKYKRRE
jgi:glucose-6-phosphate isomerase